MLKMETTHRRIFKANEYNTVVYGPGSPYYFESPLSSISMSPLQRYPPNQLPSMPPNAHSFYSSPKLPGVGNQPDLPYHFRSMTKIPMPSEPFLRDSDLKSLGKASPVGQNRASWTRSETPEPKKNFSINMGKNFPNPSAAIRHNDDVFSHWLISFSNKERTRRQLFLFQAPVYDFAVSRWLIR